MGENLLEFYPLVGIPANDLCHQVGAAPGSGQLVEVDFQYVLAVDAAPFELLSILLLVLGEEVGPGFLGGVADQFADGLELVELGCALE